MKYMLDTNICIYAIKKKPITVLNNLKKHYEDGICISAITLAELEFGVENSLYPDRNRGNLLKFLTLVTVLPFNETAVLDYGKIRSYLQKNGKVIGQMDMLIAAHAKSENVTLVTNNIKEFERVPDLKLENWV